VSTGKGEAALQDEVCKGCSASVRLTKEEIDKIFGKMPGISRVKTADEDTYQKRLAVCAECSSLEYGTTCRHCGCIVQIKAKLASSVCPYPGKPKW